MADEPRPPTGDAFKGRRVVVVGINYAPETTGIAPYTTRLCEFIADEGADVTAVVGLPHYPSWTVDPAYRRRLRSAETINRVRVVRVPHFVPARQTAARRGLFEGSFYIGSRLASRGLDADAIIGVSPTLSGLRTANALSARTGAPFGAIIQDLMGLSAEQSGMQGGRRVASLVARSELAALSRASKVGVISGSFGSVLVGAGIAPDLITVMPNFTHVVASTATRNEARRELGWPLDEHVVLHTGNMGLKQDLANVVEAARLAQDDPASSQVTFVLMGDGSQRRQLEKKARSIDSMRIVDPLPDDLYPLALASADVLLLNERPSVRDMSLPSKLTSYFASGRCVVGAVGADGATAGEILRSGAGTLVPAGEPAALLHTVQALLGDERSRVRMGMRGRDYARTHLGRNAARERGLRFVADLLGIDWPTASLAPLTRIALDEGEIEAVDLHEVITR
jgi:colanic acid biosynthesis glycosyl transferase WcaI